MPNSGSFKKDLNSNMEKLSEEKEEWPWDEILTDAKKLKDTSLDRIFTPLNSARSSAGNASNFTKAKSRHYSKKCVS